MNRGGKRKPILKGDKTEKGGGNKRLSFAMGVEAATIETPTGKRRAYSDIVSTNIQSKLRNLDISPKVGKSAEKTKERNRKSSRESMGSKTSETETVGLSFDGNTTNKTLLCPSLTRTSLGNCYVPQDRSHHRRIHKIDTVTLGQNKRNVFASVLDSFSASPPKANVLIIGDEGIGLKIKDHLLKLYNFQSKTQFRAVEIQLNITCCNVPDENQISVGHLFMIIVKLDRLESQRHMQSTIKKLQEGGVPCHRMVVLSVQPTPGQHCVVVDMEEFTFLLSQHCLVSYPWIEEGRPSKTEGERLLGLIHHCVGCGQGTSLLQENIAQFKLKEERDDRSHFYGSLHD